MPYQIGKLPPGIKTLTVNNYQMAYLECGQGIPLVLVHGSLNDYRAWTTQMEAFGACYRTIAVSLRHGYPECWNGRGGNYSIHQHADDLARFVQALNLGPVHLAGHSRGGDVALIVAARHSGLLRTLVLADPAPLDGLLPRTAEVILAAEKRRAFVTAALQRLQQGDTEGGLEIFIDAVSTPGSWKRLPPSARQIRRENAWSIVSLLADAREPFSCADAQKIDVPVLLVAGENSPPLYGMMRDALKTCLNRYQEVTIPRASHGMNRDNPDSFNRAVLDFLARQAAR